MRFAQTHVVFVASALLSASACEELPPPPPRCTLPAGETVCVSDAQCDDGVFCNGRETCNPGDPAASPCGCVRSAPGCPAGHECQEAERRCMAPCTVTRDADGDGAVAQACGGSDCDDADPNRYPGNAEVCDPANHDEDCDPTTFGVRDADADGHPDAACCNADGGGTLRCGDDCDDTRAGVHYGLGDHCDGLDNDCDGAVDEGSVVPLYLDADGDGHGVRGGTAVLACPGTAGLSTLSNDCDDKNEAIQPGAFKCAGAGEIDRCEGSNGEFVRETCPGQTTCRPQPNGTGLCL